MKILSPKAAKELNLKSIPDFVFEAFNNLLIKTATIIVLFFT